MLNILQIKQYKNILCTHILSSQFVYSCINQKCELKNQTLILENKKNKKINYLYLFLLTNKKPYVKKQYILSKNLNKNITSTKIKSLTWKTEIKKKSFYEILSHLLFKIFFFQANSEKKIFQIEERKLNLIAPYAPLTMRTAGLKQKNNYFSDIRLNWRLKWTKNSSIFQKLFLLKFLGALHKSNTYKRLENVIE